MNSLVESFSVKFHDQDLPIEGIINNDDERFGILKLKIREGKIIKYPLFLLFSLDITGSMSEPASHNSTKIDCLIQTFNNIISFLSTCGATVYIKVNTFNETCVTLVDTTLVTPTNVNVIQEQIKKALEPNGCTNIGAALKKAATDMNFYINENPKNIVGHIFLSDGDPTSGERNFTVLANMIDIKYQNTFLGFGIHHNAELFQMFASKRLAEYRFIDNVEISSLVYGEVLNNYLYPGINNIAITITNASIYDYNTNTWVTSLFEDTICTEIERIYHIKTRNLNDVIITATLSGELKGIPIDSMEDYDNERTSQVEKLCELQSTFNNANKENLDRYLFRQKVQELLFRSKELNSGSSINKEDLVKCMKDTFKTIKAYMQDNDLVSDSFFVMLCDDIHIVYRTLDSQVGVMYATSRITCQGKQQSYQTSSPAQIINNVTPNQHPSVFQMSSMPCTPRRGGRSGIHFGGAVPHPPFQFGSFINPPLPGDPLSALGDDLDLYSPSKTTNKTCFSTPTAIKTMSSIMKKNDF